MNLCRSVVICGRIPLQMHADLGYLSNKAWAINNASGKQLNEVAGSAGAEIKALMVTGRKA